MLEGTARQLNPHFSLAEVLEGHQVRAGHTLADPRRWLRKMERSCRGWERLAKVLPGTLADVWSGLRGETFELKHSGLHQEEAVDRLVNGALAAALFLQTALLLGRASRDAVGYGANAIGVVSLEVAVAITIRLQRGIRKAEREQRLNRPSNTHGDPAMSAPAPSRWRLALFAFALGSLTTLALVGGAYYAIDRARQSQAPRPRPRPVYSRAEFSRRVLGKSEEEVIDAVGRPDETSEDDDARYWHFKKRTLDPLTQEKDADVQVVIKGGKVSSINY